MLDLWRGAAAFWVVLAHATIYAGAGALGSTGVLTGISHGLMKISRIGWYGVPMFFVISGYCIAATATSHFRQRHHAADFFVRRFRRIFPPYGIALAFTLAIYAVAHLFSSAGYLNQPPFEFPVLRTLMPSNWVGNVTLTELWVHHLFGGQVHVILDPSWSLMYEEQFYLVCGLALIVLGARFLSGAAVVTVAVVVGMLVTNGSWPNGYDGFFFDGRWLLFALGLAVFYYIKHATARSRPLFLVGFVSVVFLAVGLRFGWLGQLQSQRQQLMAAEFVGGALFALVLVVAHRWDDVLRWHVALRPIAYLGRISYSLYILHMPVAKIMSYTLLKLGVVSDWQILLITVPAVTGISVLYAAIFFHFVERRFLNSPNAVIPLIRPQA